MAKQKNKNYIVYSQNINPITFESIKKQIVSLPKFWKKRFVEDEWQIILTDIMPEEVAGILTQYYFRNDENRIWVNINLPSFYGNIIYKCWAIYITMEYGDVSKYDTFKKIIENERKALKVFMTFRGNVSYDAIQIFLEMFSYVIETKGKNIHHKIDKTYQYVKMWVNAEIFSKTYVSSFKHIYIDNYVIEEQVDIVEYAYNSLPVKIRNLFEKNNWKIRVSKKTIFDTSVYGLCSSFDKTIYIRSSSPHLLKTVYHEFGHFLDYKENIISSSVKFSVIYNQEKALFNNIVTNESECLYAISSKSEYFAELFAYYMIMPNKVKDTLPISYSFIEKILVKWL